MDEHILREWYIIICILCHHVAYGCCIVLPSVVTPIITGNHTDLHATKEEASWFTAVYGFTGSVGFVLLPAIMQIYGRRVVTVLMNCFVFIGSIMIAVAPDVTTLIIARAIQGLAFCGIVLCCIIIGEYVHPKRRGAFVAFKLSATSMGELLCHSLGLVLSWRHIAWISAIPAFFGILGIFLWPESPAWLAYKCRYEECAASFKYLRGDDKVARDELRELVTSQQELQKTSLTYGSSFMAALKALKSIDFWHPFAISSLLAVVITTSGHFYLISYLIEIMTKITGDRSKAYYYSIGFDLMKLMGALVWCVVIRLFNRKVILMYCGFVSCVLLGLVCIFHYLESIGSISVNWVTALFLVVYIFASGGILSIAVVSKGELFPLNYRGIGTSAGGIILSLLTFLSLKFTSNMLRWIDIHGTLAVYLVLTAITLLMLNFFLPETKDRTLQDIENEFVGLKLSRNSKDDLNEESVTLVDANAAK